MIKKALKFGTVGFLIGCFAYLLFSIVVSLRMDTGDFYFALPALIQLCVHCRRYFAFYIFDWISEIEMRC